MPLNLLLCCDKTNVPVQTIVWLNFSKIGIDQCLGVQCVIDTTFSPGFSIFKSPGRNILSICAHFVHILKRIRQPLAL